MIKTSKNPYILGIGGVVSTLVKVFCPYADLPYTWLTYFLVDTWCEYVNYFQVIDQLLWHTPTIIQVATGNNIKVYSMLERILSTALAVEEVFKDEANATDTEFTFYVKELLQWAARTYLFVVY